jgi:hypothetical protein
MKVLEEFYVYGESQMSNQINDTSTSGHNRILETKVPQSCHILLCRLAANSHWLLKEHAA